MLSGPGLTHRCGRCTSPELLLNCQVQVRSLTSQPDRGTGPQHQRVCFRWNSIAGCHLVECKFAHICSRCRNASHTALLCPHIKGQFPPGSYPQQGPWQGWQTTPASRVTQGHCRGSTLSSLFVPHQGDVRGGTRPSQTNTQSYYDSGSVDLTLPLLIHMLSEYYSEKLTEDIDQLVSISLNPGHTSDYPYTADLDSCQGKTGTRLPHAACMITIPLKVAEWEHLLRDHPNWSYVDYLLRGMFSNM